MKLEHLNKLASDSADWRHKQRLDQHWRDNGPRMLEALRLARQGLTIGCMALEQDKALNAVEWAIRNAEEAKDG